jgi:hypothetical protein
MKILKFFKIAILLLFVLTSDFNFVDSYKLKRREGGKKSFITKLRSAFKKYSDKLQNSKFFNFVLGAALKFISLAESNVIIDTAKCIAVGIETYYTGVKPSSKDAKDKKPEDMLTEALNEDKENDEFDKDVVKSEIEARKANCASTSDLESAEDLELFDDEETLEEDLEDELEEVKKEKTRKYRRGFKSKMTKLKNKVKKIAGKVKEKFKKALEKFKEGFKKLGEKIKVWLNKPITKAIIAFAECALPVLFQAVSGGAAAFTNLMSGFAVFKFIANGPKYLKMILDAVKSFRTAFLKKADDIKGKFMEYGKGTASLIMIVLLSVLGRRRRKLK